MFFQWIRLLTEPAIRTICEYEEELRSCFVAYMSENYKKGRLLLKWEELALDNKKLTSFALARFLNDSQVVPHHLSAELVQDVMSKICPSVSPRESEFYQKHRIVQVFDHEIEKGINSFVNN